MILLITYSLNGSWETKNYKVFFFPGKSQLLLSEIAGVKPAFLNNVDTDSSGIIYISDSCRTWHMKEFLYPCLEGSGTGRCDLLSSSTCTLPVTGNISLTFFIPQTAVSD